MPHQLLPSFVRLLSLFVFFARGFFFSLFPLHPEHHLPNTFRRSRVFSLFAGSLFSRFPLACDARVFFCASCAPHHLLLLLFTQHFKAGDVRFLICTDVAARGIDIHVRQFRDKKSLLGVSLFFPAPQGGRRSSFQPFGEGSFFLALSISMYGVRGLRVRVCTNVSVLVSMLP